MSVLPGHLQALLLPRAYPHPVHAVQLIETHVSWVLLTGEFATRSSGLYGIPLFE